MRCDDHTETASGGQNKAMRYSQVFSEMFFFEIFELHNFDVTVTFSTLI